MHPEARLGISDDSSCLGRAKGDVRDLRRTVEAKRKAYRPDSAVDVKLHRSYPEPAFDKFPAARRQFQGAYKRHANLAAMGMAAQHQANRLPGGMSRKVVRIIGGVAHDNHGLIRHLPNGRRNCGIEVGLSANRIVEPGEPDPAASPLAWKIRVV